MHPGDEIYYHHPKRGTTSGKVSAVGRHGVEVHNPDKPKEPIRVRHKHILGHKSKSHRRMEILDQGEDGAIVREGGQTRYISGQIPEAEAPEPGYAPPPDLDTKHGPHNVQPGAKIRFKAGDFNGEGKVVCTGVHGTTVADSTGRNHQVHWHEVEELRA